MRSRNLLLGASFLLLMISGLSFGQGQEPKGTFNIDRAHSDDVNAAIEKAVAQVNFVERSLMRSQLRRENVTPVRVSIAHIGGNFVIGFDSHPQMTSPDTGRSIKWTDPSGNSFTISTVIDGASLVQEMNAAADGERTSRIFTPTAHGLKMAVTVRNPKLPQPLTYTLLFTRDARAPQPRANRRSNH